MSKKKKIKQGRTNTPGEPQQSKPKRQKSKSPKLWPWIIPIVLITGIFLFPMLQNGFTNWDDEYYVVQNALLRGPDWAGIFSKSVVSNYHPVTVATLAANYAMTGLDASSYLVTNLLLHLVNTGLVFYFIWLISGQKLWVAAFTALVFGIHPMHVESVAWVSERKDVLYTLFFLLSLIQYWYFLNNKNKKNLFYCFIFFALSILSKPAAIILPGILFLLDYWFGRGSWKNHFVEKVPFLVVSVVMAVVTVKIQSKTAIAGLDFYPLWTRFFFAAYTSMMYIVRFFCSLSFIGISSISNDQGHAIANDAIANFYGGFNDVSLVQEKEQADRVFLFLFYDQPDPRSTISIDRGNASFGKIYVCSLYWPGIFIGNVT